MLFNTMKTLKAAPLIFLLIYTSVSIRWPTHTICKNDHLEIYYRSCDPLQDLALSFGTCSHIVDRSVTVRIATVLRHSIKELNVKVSLVVDENSIPVYSKQLCEQNHPQFTFCGKKKGELIYYEGPVSVGLHEIPQGDFNLTVALFNEDHRTIVCADFNIKSH